MDFDPGVFGRGFHHFVQAEYRMLGIPLSIVFHITTFAVLLLVFLYGNKYKKLFTVYFTACWLFLFGYWGVYAVFYWAGQGILYLLTFLAAPVLLGIIAFNWLKELKTPKIDLDFRRVKIPRLPVLIILAWGFWYPTYIYGQGFVVNAGDLLFSCYGLMPCPTTMVVLSLFTLNYPSGNRVLFKLLTAYCVIIGTATVMTGWLPDIPMVLLGIYALILILAEKRREKKSKHIAGHTEENSDSAV